MSCVGNCRIILIIILGSVIISFSIYKALFVLRFLVTISISFLFCFSAYSQAVTLADSKGTLTLDYISQRSVVLEFSFTDILASTDVNSVSVADDKDTVRILQEVRGVIVDWKSVGTRSQPSLEVISSLNPDLMIADIGRNNRIHLVNANVWTPSQASMAAEHIAKDLINALSR